MPVRVPGVAGPANFQRRLSDGLLQNGVGVTYDLGSFDYDVLLVIGGSRQFAKLRKARNQGIPIVQRLNGMNWIHRQVFTGIRHYLRAEFNNYILRLIRDRFADWVVYQSVFAQRWWEGKYGRVKAESSVILNGVPLDVYSPIGGGDQPTDFLRLLMVEGNLGGGYEVGLQAGIQLALGLDHRIDRKVELEVVGNVSERMKTKFSVDPSLSIHWVGLVPAEEVPNHYRSAHLFFAGDPNPACPNAVIEAMACGLPVIAFETGALPEIVDGGSGRIVPYGGNVWELDPPDIDALAEVAMQVVEQLAEYKDNARKRAVEAFDAKDMVNRYMAVFERVRDGGTAG